MIKGQIYVLSGPSGVGKGTVVKEVIKNGKDVVLSVSATTRSPREGEAEGINYFFKTHSEFEKMIEENAFMEKVRKVDFGKRKRGEDSSFHFIFSTYFDILTMLVLQ